MVPNEHTPTSPDVAVLNAKYDMLAQSMNDMRSSMSSNFSALSTKFDVVTNLVREITRMQEKQEGHATGLSRAFQEIEDLRKQMHEWDKENGNWRLQHEAATQLYRENILAERDEWRRVHAAEHAAIEKRSHTVRGIALGIASVYTLLLGLLLWVANGLINKLDAVDSRTRVMEIDHARGGNERNGQLGARHVDSP